MPAGLGGFATTRAATASGAAAGGAAPSRATWPAGPTGAAGTSSRAAGTARRVTRTARWPPVAFDAALRRTAGQRRSIRPSDRRLRPGRRGGPLVSPLPVLWPVIASVTHATSFTGVRLSVRQYWGGQMIETACRGFPRRDAATYVRFCPCRSWSPHVQVRTTKSSGSSHNFDTLRPHTPGTPQIHGPSPGAQEWP